MKRFIEAIPIACPACRFKYGSGQRIFLAKVEGPNYYGSENGERETDSRG